MNKESNSPSSKHGKSFSFFFGVAMIIALSICLGGMIYSCIQFSVTTSAFSRECENVLLTISSRAAMADLSSALPAPTDGSSSAPPSGTVSDKDDTIQSLITHMENMVAIQKSGMTNDVMSFIYGILSSVLVGLCAAFVVKSQNHADNANKTAEKAKLQASIAEEKAKETENAITQAQDAAKMAAENAETAKLQAATAEKKAKETEHAIEQAQNAAKIAKELQYQIRLVIVSSRIAAAKAALSGLNYLYANRLISQIREEIRSLFFDRE